MEEEENVVFLDIACCFRGYALREVEDTLRALYDDFIKHHIGMLVKKSLIKISLLSLKIMKKMKKIFVLHNALSVTEIRSAPWLILQFYLSRLSASCSGLSVFFCFSIVFLLCIEKRVFLFFYCFPALYRRPYASLLNRLFPFKNIHPFHILSSFFSFVFLFYTVFNHFKVWISG